MGQFKKYIIGIVFVIGIFTACDKKDGVNPDSFVEAGAMTDNTENTQKVESTQRAEAEENIESNGITEAESNTAIKESVTAEQSTGKEDSTQSEESNKLEQYEQQLIGTWKDNDGDLLVFGEGGSGSWTIGSETFREYWSIGEAVSSDYDYLLMMREEGAKMVVDYIMTVTDADTLSMKLEDGQIFELKRQ